MDLAEVLLQDPNRLATSSLNDMFNFQKQALANENQGMQNDRYSQITPYEVAQQKLAGLRAANMSDPNAIDKYARGTLAQFDIQDRANRQSQAVEDAGINTKLLEAQKLQREEQASKLASGLSEVSQMFAMGARPEDVYKHVSETYGQDAAEYFKPVISQGQKGVDLFHNHLLNNDPSYRKAMDVAREHSRGSIGSASVRANFGGGGTDLREIKLQQTALKSEITSAERELRGHDMDKPYNKESPAYEQWVAERDELIRRRDTAQTLLNKVSRVPTDNAQESKTAVLPAGVTIKK